MFLLDFHPTQPWVYISRKFDVEVGDKTQFWSGMVTLA